MNKQSILKKIFPAATAVIDERGTEVNGLAKDTVPQNCDVLASGLAAAPTLGRQEHYLVSIDGALVYTRICSAMAGSGYAEYAVIHGVAVSDDDKQTLANRARNFISSCCVPKA